MTDMKWTVKVAAAPDLEAAGAALEAALEQRLLEERTDEESLASHAILEGFVTNFFSRCRERHYPFFVHHPELFETFKRFVDANVEARQKLDVLALRVEYERGRSDEAGSLSAHMEEMRATVASIAADVSMLRAGGAVPLPAPDMRIKEQRTSIAVAQHIDHEVKTRKAKKSYRDRAEPILSFMIAFLGDPIVGQITSEDIDRLDHAFSEIPGLKGIPLEHQGDLYWRYQHAQQHGWHGLTRPSVTSIQIRYRGPVWTFFAWAMKEKLFAGPVARFQVLSGEVTAPLGRDKFNNDELVRLASAPLFTGCAGPERVWTRGDCFVQNEMYWYLLILIFTGMRPGEPPQLPLDSVIRHEEVDPVSGEAVVLHAFDLRPFDPAKGRVPISSLVTLKTADSARVIPIHPVLIELGLLDRVESLKNKGETKLFPQWRPHISKKGVVRWAKPASRAFTYLREKTGVDLSRKNVSLYSTRQTMGDWLDSAKAPQRVRNRIMGHHDESNAADEYGGKGPMPNAQASVLTGLDTPIVAKVRSVLLEAKLKADRGELRRIDDEAISKAQAMLRRRPQERI